MVRRAVPFVVWTAALLVSVYLYGRRQAEAILVGIADERRFVVAPETTGRLDRLTVALHDEVMQGDIVATLDDRELLLRLDRARAELRRLEAESARDRSIAKMQASEMELEFDADLRRFATDVEQGEIQVLRELAEHEEDRVRLQGLELRLARSEKLSREAVASDARLDDDRTARDALSKRIAERARLIDDMRKRNDAAKRRYATYRASHAERSGKSVGAVLAKPLEYAVKVQALRLERINLDVTRLVLRAPASGRVARNLHRPGEVVTAGDPVVQIVEPVADQIVAYLPENRLLELRAGAPVELVRRAAPDQVIRTRVREIGARVVRLPARLTAADGVARWGIPVYIPLPDGFVVTPGEAFSVRPRPKSYSD